MINWYFSKHGDNTTISEDCQNILTFTILIINFFYKHRKSLSNMAIIYAVNCLLASLCSVHVYACMFHVPMLSLAGFT